MPMKKLLLCCVCDILLALLLAGCNNSNPPLIDKKINSKDITLIQASLIQNGNPNGMNEAKFITDHNETAALIKAFQSAYIVKEVPTVYGNSSVFRFFDEDTLVCELIFSSDFRDIIYFKNKCYDLCTEGIIY